MKKRCIPFMVSTMLVAVIGIVSSCTTNNDGDRESGFDAVDEAGFKGDRESFDSSASDGGEGDENGNTSAGIITAGEWNDLDHWPFWSGLMLSEEFGDKSEYWHFFTNNRMAVEVTDESGNTIAGVSVKLLRQTDEGLKTVWEAITDNHGQANCWLGLYQQETANAELLQVSINGEIMDGHPSICAWDSIGQTMVNRYISKAPASLKQQADIAFVVDATGSMGDEIDFLKSDLTDIIGKASSVRPGITMRTAALFYRDEGDEYLTRHSDFTEDLSETADFVKRQKAGGGGDYPEAVHTALERTLQNLSWNENARTRLAFLILDAPAHYQDDVISSLQKSIHLYAQKGIRVIPVAASGVDKNTEFMLRFFAIATGGTYVFLTDDSGVGFEHIKASVGDYKVEQLNDLLIRLINYYTE